MNLKVSPTELQILKQALFVYGEVLRRDTEANRYILECMEDHYGSGLEANLPTSMPDAVYKTLNGLS